MCTHVVTAGDQHICFHMFHSQQDAQPVSEQRKARTHTHIQTHTILSRTHRVIGKHISCSAGGGAASPPRLADQSAAIR